MEYVLSTINSVLPERRPVTVNPFLPAF